MPKKHTTTATTTMRSLRPCIIGVIAGAGAGPAGAGLNNDFRPSNSLVAHSILILIIIKSRRRRRRRRRCIVAAEALFRRRQTFMPVYTTLYVYNFPVHALHPRADPPKLFSLLKLLIIMPKIDWPVTTCPVPARTYVTWVFVGVKSDARRDRRALARPTVETAETPRARR